MNPITKAGRIIYAIPFGIFGINHFIAGADMAGLVPGWLPAPVFWVYLVGAALLAAAISILIGKLTFEACIGLAVLLASFVLTIHIPGMMDPETAQMAMTNGLKDFALLGGALLVAGISRNGVAAEEAGGDAGGYGGGPAEPTGGPTEPTGGSPETF